MRLWVLVVFVLAGLALLAGSSQAQQGQSLDLDVVFLVDQSGSMGGAAYGSRQHPDANDPRGLRFDIQLRFIDLLGSDRLQRHPEARYRLAVVSFGSTTETTMPFTPVMPGNPAEWQRLQAELNGEVSADKWRRRNLGDTNFLRAFREAHRLFTELPDDGRRARQAILVVTDGGPEVEGQTATEHMRQLIDFVKANLPADRYDIFVVALDEVNEYWPRLSGFWEQIAPGRSQRVQSPGEAGAYLAKIFNELILCEEPLCRPVRAGSLAVPPYLQTIQFDVFRTGPQDRIAVYCEGCNNAFRPNEDETKGPVVRLQRFGEALETLTIENPPPGIWRLEVVGSEPRVFMRQVEVRCVPTRLPLGTVYQFEEQTVEFQCQDGRGRLVMGYPEPYRLDLSESALKVAGQSLPLNLGGSGGVFSASFRLDVLGSYTVQIIAKTKRYREGSDGRRFELVEYRLYQEEMKDRFDVKESVLLRGTLSVQPLDPQGVSPIYDLSSGGRLRPVVIEATLEDKSGMPVDPGRVVQGTPSPLFQLRLRGQRTGDRSKEVTLKQTPGSSNRYRDEVALEEEDTYDLELRLAAQLKPGYVYDPPPLKRVVRKADPRAVVINWWLRYLLQFGPWALAALVALGLGLGPLRRWWLARQPPLLGGRLQIVARSTGQDRVLQDLSLGAGRNRRRFTRLFPQTRLRAVEARSQATPGATDPVVELTVWLPKSQAFWYISVAALIVVGPTLAGFALLGPLGTWALALGLHILGLALTIAAILATWLTASGFLPGLGDPVLDGRRLRVNDEAAITSAGVAVRYRK